MTLTIVSPQVVLAAACYLRRKHRREHPAGSFDSARRWYPDPEEARWCCKNIRRPSARWPFSLLVHCRTLTHVSVLYRVREDEVRRAVRLIPERFLYSEDAAEASLRHVLQWIAETLEARRRVQGLAGFLPVLGAWVELAQAKGWPEAERLRAIQVRVAGSLIP